MKRKNITLSLLASFCFSGVLSPAASHADNPFEKFIPRGKLLKMLKNEITGESEPEPIPANRPTRARSTPTPVGQHSQKSHHGNRSTASPHQHARPQGVRTRPLPPITKSSKKRLAGAVNGNHKDFGMTLRSSNDDHVLVAALDPKGNAAAAGMRPGDRLIGIGGGKLSSVDEFDQVAKTLGQGDQIEIGYVRRGKKLKSLVQYGVAPQTGEISATRSKPTRKGQVRSLNVTSAAQNAGMQSVLDAPVERVTRRELIAPTAKGHNVDVLNETIVNQRLRMDAMAEELKLLRKSHQPAVAPTENNWSFPDLTGPGQSR